MNRPVKNIRFKRVFLCAKITTRRAVLLAIYCLHAANIGLADQEAGTDPQEPSNWTQLSTLSPVRPLDPPLKLYGLESDKPEDGGDSSDKLQRLPAAVDSTKARQSPPTTTVVGGLDLATLESIALQYNPTLPRAAADMAAGQGRAWQAGLKPNPIAGIDYQQIGSGGKAEQFGAVLQQEFVVPEKLRLNRQVAVHDTRRLEHEMAAQRQRVLTDVRLSFIRSLRAQKQRELTAQLTSISKKSQEIALQLFKAEEVSRIDVLQAEMEVEQAKIAGQNAENRYVASWQALAAVVGQPNLPMQPLLGSLTGPTVERQFEQTLQRLRSTSPQFRALAAEIERERCNLRRQEIEPRPNLTVQGLVNWQDNGIGGGADGGLAVTMPIPVWNRNQGAVQAAYHGLVAAERQLNALELAMQEQLARVFERYKNALQQTRRFETTLMPKSSEALELTRKAYEIGEINYVSLLTAQRTFSQNQLAYLDALESLRVADSEIDGMLLSGSLTSGRNGQ